MTFLRMLPVAVLAATFTASVGLAQLRQQAPAVVITADRADGIYKSGDTVRWTVEWKRSEPAPTDAKYTLKSGGLKESGSGPLRFEGNTAHFESTFVEPNTVLAVVSWGTGGPGNRAVAGAVADPFLIRPAAEEPADFEAFWRTKLETLKSIPTNPQLTPLDSGKAGVSYAKVTLDNINGTHVQGQIARPEKGEKFPALLVTQWAGVYALQKPWVTDRAADGWLAMNIQAHDIPIDQPPQFYRDLEGNGGALRHYWKIGNEDRETSYYLRMYLAVAQSIEYLKSRPDWDGKTLVVMGGSQGGQQAIVAAGLCPETVTAVLAFQPAACDNVAPSVGRASGFPNWWAQTDGGRDANKVHETSKYFDPVYFARRIKCPVLTACGLRDDLAPPSSVLATANGIPGPKEVLILNAGHQDEGGSHQPYNRRAWGAWMPALLKGEAPPVAK